PGPRRPDPHPPAATPTLPREVSFPPLSCAPSLDPAGGRPGADADGVGVRTTVGQGDRGGDVGDVHPWWLVGRWTAGAFFHGAFRLRFAGLGNVPVTGGALLAYNHVSVLDPVVVALGADRRRRSVRFLSLAEAFEQPLVGWALRRTRQIPLRRGLGDWRAIE